VEVFQGQDNRVSEPSNTEFVVCWPIRRERIETNVDYSGDIAFTGNISGATLNVNSVSIGDGNIAVGNTVYGPDVISSTIITALGTGNGSVGTYTVSPGQIVANQTMGCGNTYYLQPTKIFFQLECHSASMIAGDYAQTITTMFRDDYAVQAFASYGNASVVPLYADEARQIPFDNDQQQIEWRYIIEAALQINPTIAASQPYAQSLNITLKPVEVVFPE